MSRGSSFFAELKRRNVLRAGALYIGAAWALAQGAAQLLPVFGVHDWVTRWVVIAAVIGFPFALGFAWFYEFTPQGLKRDSEIDPAQSVRQHTGKKLDRWIIAVMAVAIVLLLADRFALHRDDDSDAELDKSIAVLPLVNESGDQDEQYFSDGLSEDLITALSQFAGLKVIGRNSSFQFRNTKDDSKTVGAKLGVTHLLEGSVRRVGDAVRISAELVNAADGSTLWSERYDRPYKDLFTLQDDITQAVAGALKTRLLAKGSAVTHGDRPPSGNLEAYTAYLQGKFYNTRNTEVDSRKAIEEFTTAIRLDPHYAQAMATLSGTWATLAAQFLDGASAQQAYAQARTAADMALALDPDLAAAHNARGFLFLNADFDWAGAQAEFQRALQLVPNDGEARINLGSLLATLGQLERAVELSRQALAADPLHAGWYALLADYLSSLGRLDEAEQAVRKAIELQPAAVSYHEGLTVIAIKRGDAAAALAAAPQEPPGVWQDEALALAQQISGDAVAADAALQTLIDRDAGSAAYQIAEVYALRNDADKTFEWLDRAWSNRDAGIGYLLTDPFILRYKDDPRFAAFCKKVGLPLPSTQSAAGSTAK